MRSSSSIRSIAFAALIGLVVTAWPGQAFAQRRGRVVVSAGFGYSPFYDPWFQYGYPYGYPYGRVVYPYGYGYEYTSAVRIQVTPKQAEVYVDGYRAGVVDDFDGIFQRLNLRPGEHDIVLYLEGYRTWSDHLYLNPGQTQKIQMALAPLSPGERPQPRPVPPAPGPEAAPGRGMRVMPPSQLPQPGNPNQPDRRNLPPPPDRVDPPSPPDAPVDRRPADPSTYGSVAIRVQPGNADIFIDGERWSSLGSDDRLVVQLSEGKHRIEVRKGGYEPFVTDVDVKRGEVAPLNVSLKR